MANFDLLLEAERRGILPDDKKSLLTEARNRGLLEQKQPEGQNSGEFAAGVYGFEETIPMGSKITSALGAGYAKLGGAEEDFSDLYKQALADTEATKQANPLQANIGRGIGIGTQLAAGISPGKNIIQQGSLGGFGRGAQQAIQKTGEFIGRGGVGSRAIKSGIAAVPAGAAYGAGFAEPGKELEGAKSGAGMAFGAGATLPVVGAGITATGRAFVPKIEGATAKLAKRAEEFGIPLRLDQISPTRARSGIQKISQSLPFSGVDEFETMQRVSFNKALAKTIGEDAEDLSPATINRFLDNNSNKFDSVLKNKEVIISADDIDNIKGIKNNIQDTFSLTDRDANILSRQIDDIEKELLTDVNGQKLSNIRSNLLKRSTNAGSAKPVFHEVIDKIDDIAERSLTEEEKLLLQETRRNYRNFKTIEPLLEKSTDGNINPTELMNRVKSSKYIKASRSETGSDDLIDLARIGKEFLPKKGGSDTVPNLVAGASTLGNLGLMAGVSPQAALASLLMQGGAAIGNRGYQKLINQSPNLVRRAVGNPNMGKALMNTSQPITQQNIQRVSNYLMNRR